MLTSNDSAAARPLPCVPSTYTVLDTLGEGSFGVVFRAEKKFGRFSTRRVAIKQIKQKKQELKTSKQKELYRIRSVQREVTVMQHVRGHENLLGLLTVLPTANTPGEALLVSELMDGSLSDLISKHHHLDAPPLPVPSLLRQLLRAVDTLHSAGVLHRDIKPANILTRKRSAREGAGYLLKLSDFGCARGDPNAAALNVAAPMDVTDPMDVSPPTDAAPPANAAPPPLRHCLTAFTTTLKYNAPEMLLGGWYTSAADMWSVGCVHAAMLSGNGSPFTGDNSGDKILETHLESIAQALGTPSAAARKSLHGAAQRMAGSKRSERRRQYYAEMHARRLAVLDALAARPARPWCDVLGSSVDLDARSAALLDGWLAWDPDERCSARRALSTYFADNLPGADGVGGAGAVVRAPPPYDASFEELQSEDLQQHVVETLRACAKRGETWGGMR